MNTDELKKKVGSPVRLRPIAESADSRVDDLWTIRRVDPASVELRNERTGHTATLGNDNIAEFRSPDFLALRCQLTLTVDGVLVEPLFTLLGARGGPSTGAVPLTQEEHDPLIRFRERR